MMLCQHVFAGFKGDETNGSDNCSYEYGITNIEYTEFKRLGITDMAAAHGSGTSCFPANTNILYLSLEAAKNAVMTGAAEGGGGALPGLTFNMHKNVRFPCKLSDLPSLKVEA